ncbi:hypothetical protein EI94DRAFT_1731062 [Lactarius quietus]|nr:hypothetical protein EI94DRAFT_1731062 [Lactarius quietus]
MYLFGTPIRRTGASFRRATPGCIRLKLFSSRQEDSSDAVVDDEIDFPLSPSGDLDFHRVKLWWGIRTCLPLEPFSWKVFQPRDRKTISSVAIHNLTYGKQNNLFLLFAPKPTDEYKREDLGTWMHEIKWHRRTLADDPAWYFNRLVWICVFAWLASLVPGAVDVFVYAALVIAAVVRWARELLVALPECARTRSF